MFKFKSVGEVLGGFCDNIVCAYLFRPLTSGSAKKQASASSDLQKTHRKTKTQQKTNDKDIGQASGGKPKEQSSVNKNSGAVIYQVGTGKLFRGVAFHGGSVAFTFDMSGYFDFIAFF
jgi:hypothetical protein